MVKNNNIKILISGGAGYIGSVLSHHFKKNQILFSIVDNKKNINANYFPKNTKIFRGDISDKALLKKIFNEFEPTHVLHLAAYINVGESERYKSKYQINNIFKGKIFVDFFIKKKVKNFLFSSSAAVYSNRSNKKVESFKEKPANYYGKTKLDFENYLLQQKKKYNLNIIILRFFNVVGAHYALKSGNPSLESKNLLSSICKSILKKKIFKINYNFFPTRDGTAIRDFIDINDISKIIITLLKKKFIKYKVFNIGNGVGHTVLEVARLFEEITKKKLNIKFLKKKTGASNIISNNKSIKKLYPWKLTPLKDSINTHYNFYKKILECKKY